MVTSSAAWARSTTASRTAYARARVAHFLALLARVAEIHAYEAWGNARRELERILPIQAA